MATRAEPALRVLGRTVQHLSGGAFTCAMLVYAVSVGVGIGMAVGERACVRACACACVRCWPYFAGEFPNRANQKPELGVLDGFAMSGAVIRRGPRQGLQILGIPLAPYLP